MCLYCELVSLYHVGWSDLTSSHRFSLIPQDATCGLWSSLRHRTSTWLANPTSSMWPTCTAMKRWEGSSCCISFRLVYSTSPLSLRFSLYYYDKVGSLNHKCVRLYNHITDEDTFWYSHFLLSFIFKYNINWKIQIILIFYAILICYIYIWKYLFNLPLCLNFFVLLGILFKT